MLEAMGEMSCPDETTIKNILYDDLEKRFGEKSCYDIYYYKSVIDKMFTQFGGISKVGSMSGWNMFARKELLNMCVNYIEND